MKITRYLSWFVSIGLSLGIKIRQPDSGKHFLSYGLELDRSQLREPRLKYVLESMCESPGSRSMRFFDASLVHWFFWLRAAKAFHACGRLIWEIDTVLKRV